MINEIILDPDADRDIDEAAAYIAARNLDAGLRLYDAATRTFEQLAEMPGIGAVRPMKSPDLAGLRMMPITGFENYLAFYLPLKTGGVRIVRVLHGAQNIDQILGPEETAIR